METKKKLLVFASTFPRWKDDTNPPFVYELSKRLTSDFDVFVLAPHYKGAKRFEIMDNMKVYRFKYFIEKYEKLAGSGGILPTLKKNKLFYLQVPFFLTAEYFSLKKLIKKIKPDIIHAHWIIPQGFITALVKKTSRNKVEYVVTSHGSDLMGIKNLSSIKKFVMKNSKYVTVVSSALKNEVKKIDENIKVEVIPMGVDTKLFNPNKKDNSIKKKYNIQGTFLLFVGRLAPEKGIDLLIEAMPEVIKKYPKTKLMIIGDGTLKNQIQKRVNELKIKENIIFMGWVNNKDLPKYYATADVFVCPSRREGFGLTFVEAGMSGCFLIGTNTGGIKDIIKDKENGLVIERNSSKEISRAILYYDDKQKINSDYDNFSWNHISKRYLEVMR